MRTFDQRAETILAPKVKQLQYAFSVFDRDGSGMLRVPHITAYNRVISRRAEEAPPSRPLTLPDPHQLVRSLARQNKEGISFNEFRCVLARHEAAFGDDGGGKGKKGKKGKKVRAAAAVLSLSLSLVPLQEPKCPWRAPREARPGCRLGCASEPASLLCVSLGISLN
eukprot:914090-Prymnesium_polylepis.1